MIYLPFLETMNMFADNLSFKALISLKYHVSFRIAEIMVASSMFLKPFFHTLLGFLLFSSCNMNLEVKNSTSGPVSFKVGDGTNNLLGAGKSITLAFEGPARGTYISGYGDFLLNFSNDVSLTPTSPFRIDFSPSAGRMAVKNETGLALSAVYFSLASSYLWSSNMGALAVGESMTLRLTNGTWHVMATHATGSLIWSNLTVTADTSRTLRMNNTGGLYGAPVIAAP